MRKVWKSTLAVAMAVSMLATTAQAQNGPRGWYEITYPWEESQETHRVYGGDIVFYEYNENGRPIWTEDGEEWVSHEIFTDGEVKNDLQGASYDLASNTLTLKDVNQPYMALSIGQMGDDFKLKVEGECVLGEIDLYVGGGFIDDQKGYDTSMAIEGSGTLTITTGKQLESDDPLKEEAYIGEHAIRFGAGGTDCKLYIGKDVTLNLYGSEQAIAFYQTTAAVPVRFENGQRADEIKVEENLEDRRIWVPGYEYETGSTYSFGDRYVKASDPEGIYVGSSYKEEDETVRYEITKYRYLDQYGAYIPDWSFGSQGWKSMTEAEFKAEGFEAVMSRQVDNPKWVGNEDCVKMIGCEVLADEEGHKYGVFRTGTQFEGYETAVFDMEPMENSKGQYLLTINPDVDRDGLKSTDEDVYGYYFDPNGYVDSYRDTICKSDPDGIYWSQHVTTTDKDDKVIFEGSEVYKMIYLADRDLYIFDPEYTGNPNGSYTPKRFTDEEFEENFELVCDLGPEQLEADASLTYASCEIYQDEQGKQYGVRNFTGYHEDENGEWVEEVEKRVYTMDESGLVDSDGEKVYIFVPAKDVKFEDLTRVLKPLEGNTVYDAYSDRTFTYVGGTKATVTTEEIVEQKTTEKPTEQSTTGGDAKTTEQPTTQAGQTSQQPTTQAGQKVTEQPTTQAGQVQPTTQGSQTTEQPTTQAVSKKAQPMKVTVKKPTVKLSKLKKKKQTVAALTVKNAEGTVKFEKVKKGSASQLTVNTKTGKVTVKKGTKKGTYKIKIKVTAAGNDGYLSGSKTVTVKIKVK